MAVALTQYLTSDPKTSSPHIATLKNLVFYLHQNYLHLCTLLCQKLPPEAVHNIWLKQLEMILSTKMAHGYARGEELVCLLTNNTTLLQILRHLWNSAKSIGAKKERVISPLLNCVGNIMSQLDKCSIKQARDFLTKAAKASVRYLWPFPLKSKTQLHKT